MQHLARQVLNALPEEDRLLAVYRSQNVSFEEIVKELMSVRRQHGIVGEALKAANLSQQWVRVQARILKLVDGDGTRDQDPDSEEHDDG